VSDRYGAVAVRTPRELDSRALLHQVGGVPASAELAPSSVQPFMRKGSEGTVAVLSLANGWRVLWGWITLEWPDFDALRQGVERASQGGEAVFWFAEGTTGACGFMVFADGRCVRSWWEVEGEVEENGGDPLHGEPPGLFGGEPDFERDEWTVVETIVEPRVAPWDDIAQAPYESFEVRGA
jgi:hypothetical protein